MCSKTASALSARRVNHRSSVIPLSALSGKASARGCGTEWCGSTSSRRAPFLAPSSCPGRQPQGHKPAWQRGLCVLIGHEAQGHGVPRDIRRRADGGVPWFAASTRIDGDSDGHDGGASMRYETRLSASGSVYSGRAHRGKASNHPSRRRVAINRPGLWQVVSSCASQRQALEAPPASIHLGTIPSRA